jgi:hypothetical protein
MAGFSEAAYTEMCTRDWTYGFIRVGRYGNRFSLDADIRPVLPRNASGHVLAIVDDIDQAYDIAARLNAKLDVAAAAEES